MNKSKTTYQRLFQTIRQLIPNRRPTSFPIDFEMSAINAIRTVFDYDNVALNGCFSHLSENVRKRVQQTGL